MYATEFRWTPREHFGTHSMDHSLNPNDGFSPDKGSRSEVSPELTSTYFRHPLQPLTALHGAAIFITALRNRLHYADTLWDNSRHEDRAPHDSVVVDQHNKRRCVDNPLGNSSRSDKARLVLHLDLACNRLHYDCNRADNFHPLDMALHQVKPAPKQAVQSLRQSRPALSSIQTSQFPFMKMSPLQIGPLRTSSRQGILKRQDTQNLFREHTFFHLEVSSPSEWAGVFLRWVSDLE